MANYLVIGGDGKEYGPVTEEELRAWMAEGRLNGQSVIRHEGSNDWKPLASFPELQAADSIPAPPPLSGTASGNDWPNRVLAREPELRLGECLNGGMGFFLSNFGFVASSVVLAWLVNFVLAFFPLIGSILHLVLSGVITGGLYFAVLRRMRGEPVSASNIFDGFKLCFAQLMLAGAITAILTQFGMLFCILPGIYLTVAWVFALPLVVDKRLEFWSAMELSRKMVTRVWFQMALLMFLVFLPFILGNIIVSVKLTTYLAGVWNETGQDLASVFKWLGENLPNLMKQMFWTLMVVQAALLVSQFFAVGALMRAYENLFGERRS